MKLTVDKKQGTFSISGLTPIEVDVILAVTDTANKRCFNVQDDDEKWYSNDDFILSMTDEQRKALAKVGEEIQRIYNT